MDVVPFDYDWLRHHPTTCNRLLEQRGATAQSTGCQTQATPLPFLLGVNYWPRRKAMTWWRQFDRTEVAADFAQMRRDCGIDFARIFLLWEDFQPDGPDAVATSALENLTQVADIAAEAGILLDVTFFTGHMSGPNWVPRWLLASDGDSVSPASTDLMDVAPVTDGSNPYDLCVVLNGGTEVHMPPPPQPTAVVRSSEETQQQQQPQTPALPRYRNPFTDPLALRGQETLIAAVVGRLAHHPSVLLWNLGNEPDLFAIPPTVDAGVAWFRRMKRAIRLAEATAVPAAQVGGASSTHAGAPTCPIIATPPLNRQHPVTCGLHCDSLRFAANNLPVDAVFAEADVCTMHSYPMYMPWLRDVDPLDSTFVPFTCAVVAALADKRSLRPAASTMAAAGAPTTNATPAPLPAASPAFLQRPVLMEEFGGCTAPPGAPSQVWHWSSYNASRAQFMASEEEFAAYVAATLDGLVRVGCLGACLWCWADYSSDLWTLPPCAESRHERFFGIVRPDGTLKPHGAVLKAFASRAVSVVVNPAERLVLADHSWHGGGCQDVATPVIGPTSDPFLHVTLAATARGPDASSAPALDPVVYYGRNVGGADCQNARDPLHAQSILAALHARCKRALR